MSIALHTEDGERADVPKRLRVTDENARRSRAMSFYSLRLDRKTDAEIGKIWGKCRQFVNAEINALPGWVKDQVRRDKVRSLRAEYALAEMEAADAG